MTKRRVLLVEDDSMLRQFVRMALEEVDIELLEADSVAAALRLLTDGPPQLILTDLMMPGESGLGLLEHLKQQPQLRGAARIVVFSAGVTEDVRVRLQAYDVWRLLLKPVSVLELERCVLEALALTNAAPTPEPPHTDAVASYFGGDRQLFDTYLARCLAQFPKDLVAGDLALQRGDFEAMRMLAHNLKSVLRILGYSAADLARSLETACVADQAAEVAQLWQALRTQLPSAQLPS